VSQGTARPVRASGGLGIFERYLSLWVALCMAAGVILGNLIPTWVAALLAALLATLVLIFAFQAANITGRFFHVLLIAVPITLQVYFNAGLAYYL
jgi:ACR3 family arsenite efflux pump ArsB